MMTIPEWVSSTHDFSYPITVTEQSSGTGIPIESRKPPFQEEPFPGYIDSLKARILELEATVQRACDLLNWCLEWGNCTEKDIEEMCAFINKHDRDVGGKP